MVTVSVSEFFELHQLFLEANYLVLVNEPVRKNVKYRLAATSLLSKGNLSLVPDEIAVTATSW